MADSYFPTKGELGSFVIDVDTIGSEVILLAGFVILSNLFALKSCKLLFFAAGDGCKVASLSTVEIVLIGLIDLP